MSRSPSTTVYVGNLDERVDERLLYEIMIQAGPVVEIHMPRDKETKRHKSYAFAEYETEESALYALSLFPGHVNLYKRSVKFATSGQERQAHSTDENAPKSSPSQLLNTPSPTYFPFNRISSAGDVWN